MRLGRSLGVLATLAWTAVFSSGEGESGEAKEREKGNEKTAESLFNGDDLGDWKPIAFGGEGEVHVSFDGELTLENGSPFTGVVWAGDAKKLPRSNYEISLEAMKHYGDDFFCGLTFPVKDDYATLIVGGWGGVVVGISSIDGEDASLNETSQDVVFKDGRWYAIRVRVTDDRLRGWLDGKEMFDVALKGRKIGLRPGEIEKCVPLGIANFRTRSAYRKIEMRRLGKAKEGLQSRAREVGRD